MMRNPPQQASPNDGLVQLVWPVGLLSRRYRLLLPAQAEAFWASTWRFFKDTACANQVFPRAAADSGHTGCCGLGCVEGIDQGDCCCSRLQRNWACAPDGCWLEVDFGTETAIGCTQFNASAASNGRRVRFHAWDTDKSNRL